MVDRDNQFRVWTRGLFKTKNVAEIVSAPNHLDARSLLYSHDLHIALVDLGPEEPGGLSLLKWLRDRKSSPCPELPVLVVVRNIDRERLRRACEFGINGVLRVPSPADSVLEMVSSVIAKPRRLQWSGQEAPSARSGNGAGAETNGAAASSPSVYRPPAGGGSGGVYAGGVGKGMALGDSDPIPLVDDPPPAKPVEPIETIGLEVAPPSAKVMIEAIEVAEPPSKLKQEGAWAESLAETEEKTAKAKQKRDEQDDLELASAAEKPRHQPVGLDMEKILQDHALWVSSAGSQGVRINMEGEDLSGQSMRQAILTSAIMRSCDLSGSDCTEAQMQGVDLRYSEIIGGTLVNCNLAVARLRHTRLNGCLMESANLKGADLAGADLSGANLDQVDVTGANFLGANLSGADLSSVIGLTQAQLARVMGDMETKLPPGRFLVQTQDL